MEVGGEEVGGSSTSGRACLCIESITPQAIPSVPYYCGVFRYYTGVGFNGVGCVNRLTEILCLVFIVGNFYYYSLELH